MAPDDHHGEVDAYRRLRGRLLALQHRAVESLKRDAIEESAERLNLLRNGVLTVEAEHELAAIMDFAIYDLRRHGRTAVERLVARAAKLDDDGRAVLTAMGAHRYAVVRVTGHEPGAGVAVDDLLGGPAGFLFDIGLSETAERGLVLAARLVAPAELTMTTGAALPFAVVPDEGVEEIAGFFQRGPFAGLNALPPAGRSELTEGLIQVALERAAGTVMLSHDPTAPVRPDDPGGAGRGVGPAGPRSRMAGRLAVRAKKRKR